MKLYSLLFLSLVYLLSCSSSNSVSTESETELIVSLLGGVVNEESEPISGIEVRLKHLGLLDTTDNDGKYYLQLSLDSSLNLDSDTILFYQDSILVATYNVDKFIDTIPDIVIVRRSIEGTLLGNYNGIGKIKSVAFKLGQSNTDSVAIPMDYQSSTRNFSGFADFRQTSASDSFAVFVRVYDTLGMYIGRSEVLSFRAVSGDLNIKNFDPQNLMPKIKVSPTGSLLSGEPIGILAQPSIDSADEIFYNEIISYEWYVDDSLQSQLSSPLWETSLTNSGDDSTIVIKLKIKYLENSTFELLDTLSVLPLGEGKRVNINLKGNIINHLLQPYSGIKLSLSAFNLTSTTDSLGNYSLDTIGLLSKELLSDTLRIYKDTTLLGWFPVEDFVDTLDTIIIKSFTIQGQFAGVYPDLGFAKITVGQEESGLFDYIFDLNYQAGYKNYNGSILLAAMGDSISYYARARSYSTSNIYLGQSKALPLAGISGTLDFETFDAKNMTPKIEMFSVYVTVGDSVVLNGTSWAQNALFEDQVESYSWAVNGSEFTTVNKDTSIIISEEMGDWFYINLKVDFITGDTLYAIKKVYVQTPLIINYGDDLSELNSANWFSKVVQDSPTVITDDTLNFKVGSGSVKMETQAGFDAALCYSTQNIKASITENDSLRFWLYTENTNEFNFQGGTIIRIHTSSGTANYSTDVNVYNSSLNKWQDIFMPLSGDSGWQRADSAIVNFNEVTGIEFHADTWGYGFQLWVDGVRFVKGN